MTRAGLDQVRTLVPGPGNPPSVRALQVAAVVVTAIAALALSLLPTKAPPRYTAPVQPVPAAGTAPRSGTAPGSVSGSVPAVASTAVAVGDGLSADADSAFACAAALDRGWRCVAVAGAGSGYLSRGTAGSYAEQIAGAADTVGVGLVVLSGGGVDAGADPVALAAAASTAVSAASRRFPEATLIVLTPFPAAGDSPAMTAARDALLRAGAGPAGVQVIDTRAWFSSVDAVFAPGGRSLSAPAFTEARARLAAVLPQAPRAG